jgi:hypothetical protein
MSIKGSVPAHAYYGAPVSGIRPAGMQGGSRLASGSGPYVGRGNKCSAKNDTCMGNRVKNQELCAGHLRSVRVKKAAPVLSEPKVAEVVEIEVVEDGV